MAVTEDEELIVRPNLVESCYKVKGVFGDFIKGSQFFLDVDSDEILDVFPQEFIDLDFLFGGGLVFRHSIDGSG